MNGQALAEYIKAAHVVPDDVSGFVAKRIERLTRMIAHRESDVAKRRSQQGKLVSLELQEIEALRWALRVVTLPELQGECFAQLFGKGERVVEDV